MNDKSRRKPDIKMDVPKAKAIYTLGEVGELSNGMEFIEFRDHFDEICSVQQSGFVIEPYAKGVGALWLGIDQIQLKIKAEDANKLGIETDQVTGLIPYPVPEEVRRAGRMHLDRTRVAALITHLQRWLDAGELSS